ncbi:hypothetical protein MES5069_110109 [Mesorhizobium escarrei]|uniref:Transposase InsH N-terminal domain-containing protein n=1 Tax=Mesorhizobium escarrei TaxID=666018 RepID=A0ABM9DG61_9HYPH|nr:hypothetical protein MES5069_110109 [Mesorhizobium escarrei]
MIVNEALVALEREFAALYSPIGRPSIRPEKLRAMLLQAFYSIRSERLLMERLDYDLLFRRFVSIGVDDAAWAGRHCKISSSLTLADAVKKTGISRS